MRAALYLRVSTDEQTTANQRHALVKAAEFFGHTIVATYEDEGRSGSTRDKRPQLAAMLADARLRKFDIILVWDISRLSRSLQDLLAISREIESAGVHVYYHNQRIDSSTSAGRLLFHIVGAIGEFERATLIERTKAGMARSRAEGKVHRRPPIADETRLALYHLILEAKLPEREIATRCQVSKSMVNLAKREIRSGEANRLIYGAPGQSSAGQAGGHDQPSADHHNPVTQVFDEAAD